MKYTKTAALIISLILSLPLTAVNYASHCLAFWGQGGVANYIGKTNGAKPSIGGGGGIGIGYEYRARTLLLQTGLGFQYTQTGLKINAGPYDVNGMYDDEGDLINIYRFEENNRRDASSQLALQLPVMVGAHYNAFYFLGGVKLNVYAYNQTKAKASYRTLGYYEMFIDPFEDMPNHHFYSSTDLSTSIKNPLSINVAVGVELGGEFALKSSRGSGDKFLRVAAFADFNLLNDAKKSAKPLIDYPTYWDGLASLETLKQVDYLHSSMASNPLRQLVAGVKVTFLISSGVKYGCIICQGGYPSDRDRRRGSRLQLNN